MTRATADKPLINGGEARAVSDAPQNALQRYLVEHYREFRDQLERRLGSREAAEDSLHDTWLRLGRVGGGVADNPAAYIIRTALNVAHDNREQQARQLPVADVEVLRRLDHDELDPEREVAARCDARVCDEALAELPERCKNIFIEARFNGVTYAQLAERFGIDVRTVRREIERAVAHFRGRLGVPP